MVFQPGTVLPDHPVSPEKLDHLERWVPMETMANQENKDSIRNQVWTTELDVSDALRDLLDPMELLVSRE